MIIAVKNLVAERSRFVLSVVGVGFAVMLVLVMAGIFAGTKSQVMAYINHSTGSVWVTQPGVSQMFRAVSRLPANDAERLLALPEVKSADPILAQPTVFTHNSVETAYFVLGYDTTTGVGGPWSLSQGRGIERTGEVVFDRVMAKENNIHVGDKVRIIDEDFTVVGLSNQTAYYAFVSMEDAVRLLRAGNNVSFFLVQPEDGYTPEHVAAAIQQDLPGVDALTATAFADNSRDVIVRMIGRPLEAMIAIAALVGVALVGLTVLAVTTEQMADFAVLRALGVRPIQLCRTVVAQAALIAAVGYLAGAGVTYAAQFLIGDNMGDVTVQVTPPMLVNMAVATAAMALAGSLLPIYRVSRTDPAVVFRR